MKIGQKHTQGMFLHQAKLYPGIFLRTKISQKHTQGMFLHQTKLYPPLRIY